MDLTEDEIEALTLQIKETIDNFKPEFNTTPIMYNCNRYHSPINYPVICVNKKDKRIAIIEINFK